MSTSHKGIEKLLGEVKDKSEKQNLYLNVAKIKIMTTDETNMTKDIFINGEKIENVNSFEILVHC